MKLTYLVNKQKKAVLCIAAEFGTVSGRMSWSRQPRGWGTSHSDFSPELTHATEIDLWRRLFGSDIERLEQHSRSRVTDPVPWQNDVGVYYTGWRLWSLHNVFKEEVWQPWPPLGGDLAILAIDPDENAEPPRVPVRLADLDV